jgi:hypothetical protein
MPPPDGDEGGGGEGGGAGGDSDLDCVDGDEGLCDESEETLELFEGAAVSLELFVDVS